MNFGTFRDNGCALAPGTVVIRLLCRTKRSHVEYYRNIREAKRVFIDFHKSSSIRARLAFFRRRAARGRYEHVKGSYRRLSRNVQDIGD